MERNAIDEAMQNKDVNLPTRGNFYGSVAIFGAGQLPFPCHDAAVPWENSA